MNTTNAYAGSIESIVLPLDDATNSLPMNKPVGCVHATPLGALSSTERLDIVSSSKGSVMFRVGEKERSLSQLQHAVQDAEYEEARLGNGYEEGSTVIR
jgi:hypothetical protein